MKKRESKIPRTQEDDAPENTKKATKDATQVKAAGGGESSLRAGLPWGHAYARVAKSKAIRQEGV